MNKLQLIKMVEDFKQGLDFSSFSEFNEKFGTIWNKEITSTELLDVVNEHKLNIKYDNELETWVVSKFDCYRAYSGKTVEQAIKHFINTNNLGE